MSDSKTPTSRTDDELYRATINGHIERVEECRDWIEHEHIMEGGDTSGRLGEFVESLRIVLDRLAAAEAECERLASESLRAHAEYKERRNAQFAAYELAHRATIAYLFDRAEQYDNSSGYRAAFDELIAGIRKWEHVTAAEHGEYDDLWKRVDQILGPKRERSSLVERLESQLSAVTVAIRDYFDADDEFDALNVREPGFEEAGARLGEAREKLRAAGSKL